MAKKQIINQGMFLGPRVQGLEARAPLDFRTVLILLLSILNGSIYCNYLSPSYT